MTNTLTSIDLKRKVLNRLTAYCQGRQLALSGVELAEGLCDYRTVRRIIRELIKEGCPIASATTEPAGYFIAVTEEEVKEYAQALRGRLIEDALRRRDFLRAATTKVEPRQIQRGLIPQLQPIMQALQYYRGGINARTKGKLSKARRVRAT